MDDVLKVFLVHFINADSHAILQTKPGDLGCESASRLLPFISTISFTIVTHPITGLFSKTTWVNQCQKGKLLWILIKQQMMG